MSRTAVTHTDSIQEEDPNNEAPKKVKSRRPANTAFRQQRLKAWQPILTPKTVIPIFFVLGIIFAPIGGLLLYASATVQELSIDYTNCNSTAPTGTFATIPSSAVKYSFKNKNVTAAQWSKRTQDVTPDYGVVQPGATVCTLQFNVPNDLPSPVYLYYRLTNFYQNHRRYVKSLDLNQLKGQALTNNQMSSSQCTPLTTRTINGTKKPIYPCGLIANSIFNDTINSPRSVGSGGKDYEMTSQGIAWSSDLSLYKDTQYTNDQAYPPPDWDARFPDGYTAENGIPNLSTYEQFAVWMRTAGLPTFSKLALRNDNEAMPANQYHIDIYDFFPVKEYGGTKTLLLSTRTVVGGKNDFLGIAYVVVGGLCMVLGVCFTVAHLIKPRKLGDHTYLSWNEPTSGTSTGVSR